MVGGCVAVLVAAVLVLQVHAGDTLVDVDHEGHIDLYERMGESETHNPVLLNVLIKSIWPDVAHIIARTVREIKAPLPFGGYEVSFSIPNGGLRDIIVNPVKAYSAKVNRKHGLSQIEVDVVLIGKVDVDILLRSPNLLPAIFARCTHVRASVRLWAQLKGLQELSIGVQQVHDLRATTRLGITRYRIPLPAQQHISSVALGAVKQLLLNTGDHPLRIPLVSQRDIYGPPSHLPDSLGDHVIPANTAPGVDVTVSLASHPIDLSGSLSSESSGSLSEYEDAVEPLLTLPPHTIAFLRMLALQLGLARTRDLAQEVATGRMRPHTRSLAVRLFGTRTLTDGFVVNEMKQIVERHGLNVVLEVLQPRIFET